MEKGQVEIVVLVGLIFLAVVVIYYAYITVPAGPPTLTQKQALVSDSITNFIREAAYATMRNLSAYGGYLTPQTISVSFLNKPVTYWQYNGQINYPDLKTNFEQGVTDYLVNNKAALEEMFQGQNVTIGSPVVSATVLDNRMDLQVNMPTSLQGQPIPQPYKVTVQTKLGEVYDFSKKFVDFETNQRFFEYSTLSSMLLSPYDNGVQTVPVLIFLTDCGDYVYKDWFTIKPEVENVIQQTLANTYMPGKVPLKTLETSSSPKYGLPELDGKNYSSLNVSFWTPDDFELTMTNFQFTPNPILVWAEPVPLMASCYAEPIQVKYYLVYPVVTEVKDTLTGNLFRFAFTVYLKNNRPGDWGVMGGYTTEIQQRICENPGCPVDLTVRDTTGRPVPGAVVSFIGCPLGQTDNEGKIEGLIAPCGVGPLEVYADGYGTFSEGRSSTELTEATITIKKKPVINLHLHEVNVQNWSEQYMVDQINYIDSGVAGDETVHLIFYDKDTGESYNRLFPDPVGRITQIPVGEYGVTAILYSSDMKKVLGGILLSSFPITDDLDGGDLHMYLPYTLGFNDLEANDQIVGAAVMTNLLTACGITPINTTDVTADVPLPCFKSHSELIE